MTLYIYIRSATTSALWSCECWPVVLNTKVLIVNISAIRANPLTFPVLLGTTWDPKCLQVRCNIFHFNLELQSCSANWKCQSSTLLFYQPKQHATRDFRLSAAAPHRVSTPAPAAAAPAPAPAAVPALAAPRRAVALTVRVGDSTLKASKR